MADEHTLEISQGDTRPVEEYLLDGIGTPLDLTGASVEFHLATEARAAVDLDGTVTILDAKRGLVRYTPVVADWDDLAEGRYWREWEATLADGTIVTVPSGGKGYETLCRQDLG